MASYSLNRAALEHARELIERRQYVLRSDWGERQPRAVDQNRFLKTHTWAEYAAFFYWNTIYHEGQVNYIQVLYGDMS